MDKDPQLVQRRRSQPIERVYCWIFDVEKELKKAAAEEGMSARDLEKEQAQRRREEERAARLERKRQQEEELASLRRELKGKYVVRD